VWYLCREKIPLLILVVISSAVTFIAQQRGNSVTTFANSPLASRVENGIQAYVKYLDKTFWPRDLAVFYPFPTEFPVWQTTGAFLLMAIISFWAFSQRSQRPYIIVGWLWYCCTMGPVIGIVRVGLQAMADRYTYIPLTGIFIMLVWWVADISKTWVRREYVLTLMTAVAITACMLLTRQQVSYWRNTTTLFTHALASTRDNFLAHSMLAFQLDEAGRSDEALEHLDQAVNIAPWFEYAKIQQGMILKNQGRLEAAALKYTEAILENNKTVSGHINLGLVMALQDRLDEARQHFEIAVFLDPSSAIGHYNLGLTLSKLERLDEAIEHYKTANRIDPFNADCHNNLGVALVSKGRVAEAIQEFSAALKLKANFFDAYSNRELAIRMQESQRHTP
jgi:Tfp pilus assembly protein PilF